MIDTGYLGTAPDGTPTHSFHPPPPLWCCPNHILDLPLHTARGAAAAHEAGHLVVDLLIGIHVIDVTLTTEQQQQACGVASGVSGYTQIGRIQVEIGDFLTMLAAGELAEQRWLRERGLHTSQRAWAVEIGARDDTDRALGVLREHYPGPALEDNGYRQLYWQYRPQAQHLLEDNWDRVLNLADPLADRGYLSGDEAADLAGLPNPPEADAAP